MLIKEVLQKSTDFLRGKGSLSPRLDAELILSHFLKIKRIELYIKFEQPLSEEEIKLCREAISRRGRGEPVAYILEKKDFYGRTFFVDKSVLIPRPETELLVEEVIKHIENVQRDHKDPLKVLDFGGGSGVIGITLALHLENSRITIVEISEAAVLVIKKNIDLIASHKKEFIDLKCIDVEKFESIEKYDVIATNPPYIDPQTENISEEVKNYEPHLALYAEEQGFLAIRKWLEKSLPLLKKQGLIIFEIGFDQGLKAKELFEAKKCFSNIEIMKDLAGHDRIIKAVFNG
jgi:release factor glutamine methyltransferase